MDSCLGMFGFLLVCTLLHGCRVVSFVMVDKRKAK